MLSPSELRSLRERHKMSQAEMARYLEMSPTQYGRLERGERSISEQVEEGALALDLGTPAVDSTPVDEQPDETPDSLDELPTPAYNPSDEPPVSEEEPEKPKTQTRRRRGPQRRKLTPWQEETAASFVALIQGETTPMELNGEPVLDPTTGQQIVVFVPGIAWMVGQVDAFDGMVLHQGSPALAQALVKLAPRHPFLKGFLDISTAGDEYRELFAAVAGIVGPIAAHHGMLPSLGPKAPPPPAPEEGEAVKMGANGDGPHGTF